MPSVPSFDAPDPDSPTPPYEQLRAQVARRVVAGDLPAGAKLPTVRGLAEQVGLAVNTVARVYRELEADGVVETHGRRGTFVATSSVGAGQDVAADAATYVGAARRAGLTRDEAVRALDRAWDDAGR
ncbi:GntR family transcriptional regulator [Nocardioides alkalitolerans]|uniref:GntR family transcriptional regulator n=1 Tax=Nocardioides alkalitolerans TaxID=281714 RepID=UPI00041D3488